MKNDLILSILIYLTANPIQCIEAGSISNIKAIMPISSFCSGKTNIKAKTNSKNSINALYTI